MQSLIVIPARMGSTRFPGKPLCDLMGKPMLQWVVEAARSAGAADGVVVATPDQEIVDACNGFGADVVLTSPHHPSGTDRLAEVARGTVADVYINVQGDEPLIRPSTIRVCAHPLLEDPGIAMGSVYSECAPGEWDDPAVVKVVTDLEGYALYFSRFPLPFPRNERATGIKKHVGIYAFRRDTLLAFANWAPTALERTEGLEQLRFLEHGVRIYMAQGEGAEMAVDTPEQAERVRKVLLARSSTASK